MKKYSKPIKIFATLPSGNRVFHGTLERGTFVRVVPRHHIRFSDHAFCLNTSVISELDNRQCYVLEFVFVMKTQADTYRIDFLEAIRRCKIIKNEYGEENLRIPIEDCVLVRSVAATGIPVPVAKPEPVKEEDLLQTLF